LPRKPSPWIQLGIAGKRSGGSSRGYAAGVGDVRIKKDLRSEDTVSSNNESSRRR
jgi:hypothetical protein